VIEETCFLLRKDHNTSCSVREALEHG
jgi:hypothetical protein